MTGNNGQAGGKGGRGSFGTLDLDQFDYGVALIQRVEPLEAAQSDYRYLAVNPAFAAHIGLDPRAGDLLSQHVATPDPELIALQDRCLWQRRPMRFEGYVAERDRWFDAQLTPQGLAADRTLALFVCDITARRAIEHVAENSFQRERALNAELAERVRGLMAVIRHMARRTAELAGDLEEYQLNFEGRLAALARAEAAAARHSPAAVDLEELVADTLAPFKETTGRPSYSGPEVVLGARQAGLIALALHEFATNALKHGALGHPPGQVDVEWSAQGAAHERMLRLDWRESRIPVPNEPGMGFGTELLTQVLPAQLDADVEIERGSGGLVWRLTIPLAA